jgi:hypothetical protein
VYPLFVYVEWCPALVVVLKDEDKQNKNTTQQVLGTTLHKQTEGTQDEDKQNKNTTQ